MSQSSLILQILSDRPVDDERLDQASQSLRRELLDIDGIATVGSANTESPEGTKSATSLTLASLLVHIAPGMSVSLIARQFTGVIHDWLRRNDGKRVTVKVPGRGEVDLTGLSAAEASDLIRSVLTPSNAGELPIVSK